MKMNNIGNLQHALLFGTTQFQISIDEIKSMFVTVTTLVFTTAIHYSTRIGR